MKTTHAERHTHIQYKLASSFCLILAMSLAGYANMVHVTQISVKRNSHIASVVNQSVSLTKDISQASHDTSSYTLAYLYTRKTTYREFKWQADETESDAFRALEAAIHQLPGSRAPYQCYQKALTQSTKGCAPLENSVLRLAEIGKFEQAHNLYETRSRPAQYLMEIDVDALIDSLNQYRQASEVGEAHAMQQAVILGWIVQGLILTASLIIALAISRATRKDIQELLQAQSNLSHTENHLQATVTGAPVILFALDCAGVFTLSEGSGLHAIGRRRGDAVGTSLFEFDNKTLESQFQRALAGERFLDIVRVGAVSFETWYSPQFNDLGKITGVIGVGTDVTARLNAQQQVEDLVKDLQASNAELAQAYNATIEGWSAALDLRDRETEGHSRRVMEMTVRVARSLGIDGNEIEHIRRGALLHDIGKMGIPDSVLLKPGPLTDEEWIIMRKHPQYAYDFLSAIDFLHPALEIPLCHHEKWDGTGYPHGLKGDEIPLGARIFAVVDVWDALSSDRPYRAAWNRERVLEHLQSLSGSHFDSAAVDAFLQVVNGDMSVRTIVHQTTWSAAA